MPRATPVIFLLCIAVCLPSSVLPLMGQETEEAKLKKLTDDSRARAEKIEVSVGEQARKPTLHPVPLVKYTDVPRSIEIATLWVWQDEGQPVALGKVEAHSRPGGPKWLYCFASASTEPVGGKWADDHQFKSRRPGVAWAALTGPTPNEKPDERLRQVKELFRRFSAATTDEVAADTFQLRPLAKPLHEYSSPKRGIVFGTLCGFVANGTNPDVIVAVEAVRQPGDSHAPLTWRYTAIGLTAFGIEVKLDDKPVYARGAVTSTGAHGVWAHFWEGEK